MLRVLVDPNVFVSAVVKPDGVSAEVVRAGFAGRFRFVTSPVLIDELSAVLVRPKFSSYGTAEDRAAFVNAVAGASERHPDRRIGGPAIRDPGDEYLVDLAGVAHVDLIVSGDRDLHDALGGHVDVLTPGAFLTELDREE